MSYKNDFIKFMTECGVLTFGDFTLKSGRKAPYFVNTGNYKTGKQLAKLGEFYAECIKENGISADPLFGPAYKGIPLAVSCSVALFNKYGMDVNYCFDRKEAKDHGEGGVIVGKQLTDGEKVVIIEDVITAGTAIRQVIPVLKSNADVNITGMVISVDRMERGSSTKSALKEIEETYGLKTTAIVTMSEVVEHLYNKPYNGKVIIDDTIKEAIDKYYEQYGAE